MQVGSVGEWFGAAATAAATAVALFFGVRDDEAKRHRAASRNRLRLLAEDRLLTLRRWRAGIEPPDSFKAVDTPRMDRECREFVTEVRGLGKRRMRRGVALLRSIYGERSVYVAELTKAETDAEGQSAETLRLLRAGADLVIDGDPGPLRRRATQDVEGNEFRELVAAFQALARL